MNVSCPLGYFEEFTILSLVKKLELNAFKVESQISKTGKTDRKQRLHDTDLTYSLKEAYYGMELESALFNG